MKHFVVVGVVAERLAELLDRRGEEEVIVPRGDGELRAGGRVQDFHEELLRVADDAGGVGDRDAAVRAGAVDGLPQRAVEDAARGVPRPPPAPGGPEVEHHALHAAFARSVSTQVGTAGRRSSPRWRPPR
eukprot:gene14292-biopygen8715